MSDVEAGTNKKQFSVDRAKRSRAICRICKEKCLTGEIRIAKCMPDILGTGGKKNWYHVDCIFEQFLEPQFSNIRIESSSDIDGWSSICETDQKMIEKKIRKSEEDIAKKYGLIKTEDEVGKKSVCKIQGAMQGEVSFNKLIKIYSIQTFIEINL